MHSSSEKIPFQNLSLILGARVSKWRSQWCRSWAARRSIAWQARAGGSKYFVFSLKFNLEFNIFLSVGEGRLIKIFCISIEIQFLNLRFFSSERGGGEVDQISLKTEHEKSSVMHSKFQSNLL